MLVTSRSYEEYAAMFGLGDGDPGRGLDCSAGASGFVAGARARGVDAWAVDPAYADSSELESEDLAGGQRLIDADTERFTYAW